MFGLSVVQTWTLVFVLITFGVYLYIGYLNRVRDTKGFYVAGQGVPPIANGMATAADWMSAASFISMAGLISFMGYDGAVYLMGWTGGYVLLALLLAPYLRKFGKFTVPDFVGDRYYSQHGAHRRGRSARSSSRSPTSPGRCAASASCSRASSECRSRRAS